MKSAWDMTAIESFVAMIAGLPDVPPYLRADGKRCALVDPQVVIDELNALITRAKTLVETL